MFNSGASSKVSVTISRSLRCVFPFFFSFILFLVGIADARFPDISYFSAFQRVGMSNYGIIHKTVHQKRLMFGRNEP
jgi:hypothetical protein